MPAFKHGEMSFARPSHLAAVLNETGGHDVLESLKKLVESPDVPPQTRASTIAAILAFGEPGELQAYGLDPARFTRSGQYDAALHTDALDRLIEVARFRDVQPAGDLAAALKLLMDPMHPQLQANALTLAGIWKVKGTQNKVLAAAKDDFLPIAVRAAAFGALVDMTLPECGDILAAYAQAPNPTDLR